jgi:hypothetical protein
LAQPLQNSNAIIDKDAPHVTVGRPTGPVRRSLGLVSARPDSQRTRGPPIGEANMAYNDILVFLDPAAETVERTRFAVSFGEDPLR